ncbi:RND family efflux transporter MFP subunit [Silvibacterium bohemicum]|uniref:RND family efflux transporter MFP subunit n=1 Tax=Silvibacterium bohemicum TaxID=1577686 RepID=A0A841KAT9_9BACT|nr:efflux RND transporter periplasmic adaptor subunit [Silvibacterium bohemicum]MBB6147434.1 RND family efflux transporter MFP subunit [Silvibacterium bohemicum]
MRPLRICIALIPLALSLAITACREAKPATQAAFHALPVQTLTVTSSPVATSDEYVATIKSRRSATLNPQVDGNLTEILVHSGDRVKTGQTLMEIDPARQKATVQSQAATEQQKLAVYQYNQTEVERQRKLFAAGVTSRDTLDQAEQAFANSKADYESSIASRVTQEKQLGYYSISAPFDGIVGDIPVHVGDYVSATTMLTTVDENRDLEAYIYIPTERGSLVRSGLAVDILDNNEQLLEHTKIDFISPQVDNQLQGILVKAPVHSDQAMLRTAQLVKARVVWSTNPTPVVPVLAVTRLGGQAFVYVAQDKGGKYFAQQLPVKLGDPVGNNYAVLGGLRNGDKVIVSGTQFLVDGMPVQPLG